MTRRAIDKMLKGKYQGWRIQRTVSPRGWAIYSDVGCMMALRGTLAEVEEYFKRLAGGKMKSYQEEIYKRAFKMIGWRMEMAKDAWLVYDPQAEWEEEFITLDALYVHFESNNDFYYACIKARDEIVREINNG